MFQAATGCIAQSPLVTFDVNTYAEWCSDPSGQIFSQMEYLNCRPDPLLREPSPFNILVYPNPTRDVLTLKTELDKDGEMIVQVIDISGSVRMEREFMGLEGLSSVEINVIDLPAGMYLVLVQVGTHRFVGKVMKM